MAETDADRRAAGAMTEEEADRLSEQFRPSWEEDPPTVPRDQPVPKPPSEPRSKPASGPAVTTAPVVNITNASTAPASPGTPAAARTAVPLTVTTSKKPTLVGTAPPTPVVRGAATAPGPAGDDLDWEVSTSPRPGVEPPMPIEVEELPPESKPSGIGQKYKPKDEGAPAVVLGADVQQAESGERAKLEAEHRARRAPTIVRLNAFELPPAAAPAPDEFVVPRKRSFGMVAALGLLVLGGGAGVALLVARGGSKSPSEEPKSAVTAPATVAPDMAAPAPPPAIPAAEPAATASSGASAVASTASAAPAPSEAPAVAETAPAPPAKAPPVAAKAPPVAAKAPPVAAKAPPVAAKTPSSSAKSRPAPVKPTASKPSTAAKSPAKTSGKNTIVRDTPF